MVYYDKKECWLDGKDLVVFIKIGLDVVGMSQVDFEVVLKDFVVQEILEKWKVVYDVVKIQGVLVYVVNGKYFIYIKNIKFIDFMVEFVWELVIKK